MARTEGNNKREITHGLLYTDPVVEHQMEESVSRRVRCLAQPR